MTPIVDVITPTYGQPEFTAKCFESIAATSDPAEVRVLWIDNGTVRGPCTKDTAGNDIGTQMVMAADCLRSRGFSVENILLRENLGFVKATNIGIAMATAPYVLLLNNDTELPEGWLPSLLEPFSTFPSLGMCGPRSSSNQQWQGQVPVKLDPPGWYILSRQSMLAFFCCLIKRTVFEKIGYLSEAYRLGLGDDDDFCERAKRSGFYLALRQDITVKHHHRTTFRAIYGEGGWLQYQNENLDYFKRKYGL